MCMIVALIQQMIGTDVAIVKNRSAASRQWLIQQLYWATGQQDLQAAVEAATRREQAEADRRVLVAKEEALQVSQG